MASRYTVVAKSRKDGKIVYLFKLTHMSDGQSIYSAIDVNKIKKLGVLVPAGPCWVMKCILQKIKEMAKTSNTYENRNINKNLKLEVVKVDSSKFDFELPNFRIVNGKKIKNRKIEKEEIIYKGHHGDETKRVDIFVYDVIYRKGAILKKSKEKQKVNAMLQTLINKYNESGQ